MLRTQQDDRWYKVVILYDIGEELVYLFLQIVVDWLRERHKYGREVEYHDIFEIDYKNNTIKDINTSKEIRLDEMEYDERIVKKKVGRKWKIYQKFVDKFGGKTLKDVYNKIDFNFYTWAKYGLLRVEYSIVRGKIAFIFYTQHKGIVDRVKSNKKKGLLFNFVSFLAKRIEEKEVFREMEENGILKEVVDILVL